MKKEIWSRSIREEIISALWLIAGLLAWQNDIKWLAWLLFIKAALDSLISCVFAVLETKAELMALRNPPNVQELSHATCGFREPENRSAKQKAQIALAQVMC